MDDHPAATDVLAIRCRIRLRRGRRQLARVPRTPATGPIDGSIAGKGYVMDDRVNFFREPMGFLSINHLLGRTEEMVDDRELSRIDIVFDRYVRTMWSGEDWDRISEDAERLGISQAQVILRIVREHYAQN